MNQKVNIRASGHKYSTIREQLVEWQQQANPGTRLMPERDLASHFGVSRRTIRKAVESLVEDGMLTRIQGSGVYVNEPPENHKMRICLIYPSIDEHSSAFERNVIHEVESEIRKRGGILLAASVQDNLEVPAALHSADGLVMAFPISPKLLHSRMPVVSLFVPVKGSTEITQIIIDDHQGGVTVGEYLASLGHKKIAFVGNTESCMHTKARYRGLRDAAVDADLHEPVLIPVKVNEPINSKIAEQVTGSGCTAVFCSNDYVAMSLISGLHKEGMRVPEDISVVGCDDIPAASLFEPPLTTIRIPVREMVSTAIDELEKSMMGSEQPTPKTVTYSMKLVVRESSKTSV